MRLGPIKTHEEEHKSKRRIKNREAEPVLNFIMIRREAEPAVGNHRPVKAREAEPGSYRPVRAKSDPRPKRILHHVSLRTMWASRSTLSNVSLRFKSCGGSSG